jgi:hypothetical protein
MQGACVMCTAPPFHLQGKDQTALHCAAHCGHAEVVKALVAGGCSLDVLDVSVCCMCVCVCVCVCMCVCVCVYYAYTYLYTGRVNGGLGGREGGCGD